VLDEFALVGFAGDDSFALDSDVSVVQAKLCLTIIFVVAVSDEAIFGKDGANVAIELNIVRGRAN